MSLEQEWRTFVAAKLVALTTPLVAVLTRIVTQPYPDEVAAVEFELFPNGFTEGFPARAFFMDDQNSEFFVEKDGRLAYPGTVDPELLAIDQVYSATEEDVFLARTGFVDMADRLWEVAAEQFLDWFGTCWRAAGGDRFGRRAVITVHDDLGTQRVLAEG